MTEKQEFKFTLVLLNDKLFNVYYSVESAKTLQAVSDIDKVNCQILEVTCNSFEKSILVINHFLMCQRSHNLANYEVLQRIFEVKIEEI